MKNHFYGWMKMSDEVSKEEIHEFYFNNCRMVGVLSKPLVLKGDRNPIVIILVPYGLNPRFGPHRIHVMIAREMCSRGFAVFRFDSYGCGDSDGDITDLAGLHRDDVFWRLVFDGRFMGDLEAAISYVDETLRAQKIILAGICGGAVRSLLVGANNPSVKGVIPIGFPSTIDDTSLDNVDKMNPQMASFYISAYAQKLLSLKAWMRLLSFKSEYRRIMKAFVVLVRSRLVREENSHVSHSDLSSEHEYAKGRIINRHLIESIKKSLNNGKSILTIFGGNDRYLGDFEKIIEGPHLNGTTTGRYWDYSKFIIPNSNHEFSFLEWQNKLIQKIGDWIDERFGS